MAIMTDLMTDIETTGLDPSHNAMIQLAAVKFNFQTGEIGETFNRCLAMAPKRFWDEDTRTWWGNQNQTIFRSIVERQEDPETVMKDFFHFASGDLRFWSKPLSFDYPFIQSYCRQYNLPMPVHYRTARDLNTYIAARAGGAAHVDMGHIEYPAMAHDALVDCVHQLKMLFAAKEGNFGPIEADYEEIEA